MQNAIMPLVQILRLQLTPVVLAVYVQAGSNLLRVAGEGLSLVDGPNYVDSLSFTGFFHH